MRVIFFPPRLGIPPMRALISCSLIACFCFNASAKAPVALPAGKLAEDPRLGEIQNLNGYFPFKTVDDAERWPERQQAIRRRILLSQGLWPMPTKSDLNAVVHGRVERDDYVVDRVFFESIPGHFVTGSLYRPKGKQGPFPAILSPHGHWNNGRFYQASDSQVQSDLAIGAERFEAAAKHPIQARAVQLARMGCMVFVYDMTGNADSIQIGHRPDRWEHLDRKQDWGFFTAQAELRLQNMMGLQTWNSIRSVDFILSLDDVDATRIGVTGASGGGTQSMILGAIDNRITAAMPCVMVSTSMQGGCTCENAPFLRIDQGNIDIAAAIAPRPMGLTAADDWTVELKTKGYPDLLKLYSDLGHKDRLTAAFNIHFKHNYNHVNRTVMYGFFNRHFQLGFKTPVLEQDFVPLTREEATVWTDEYSAPEGDAIGDQHEVRILSIAAADSDERLDEIVASAGTEDDRVEEVLGGAWGTILRKRFSDIDSVQMNEMTEHDSVSGLTIQTGLISHRHQRLPALVMSNKNAPRRGTIVWVTDRGKDGLYQGEQPIGMATNLAKAGYRIVTADLLGQGEFTQSGMSLKQQPMWYQRGGDRGWQRFSGYTFGYNDSLFVKRVHDVLALAKYAADSDSQPVYVVGMGREAGPVAIAAQSQSGSAIRHTFVDPEGFRFQQLTKQDDPMFVPGAVKYLDLDGLLVLCLDGKIDVVGNQSAVVQRIAQATSQSDAIRYHSGRQALTQAIEKRLLP